MRLPFFYQQSKYDSSDHAISKATYFVVSQTNLDSGSPLTGLSGAFNCISQSSKITFLKTLVSGPLSCEYLVAHTVAA